MGWSIGWDGRWRRDVGYGVPAYCDHPKCHEKIDRGLSYVCAGGVPKGGDGCGLYFCARHLSYWRKRLGSCCARCARGKDPFTPKPDHPEWIAWKLTDESWANWRAENPGEVKRLRESGQTEVQRA
jgi:hypothetical protein